MKNAIKEYIEYSDKEKKELWNTATFVFDTNVFLNLYRYSNKTRNDLINAFEKLSGRIWMPYQVAYELCQERYTVMGEANRRFELIDTEIDGFIDKLKNQLRIEKTDTDIDKLDKYLKKWIEKKKEDNYIAFTPTNDQVFLKLLELFDGKTGEPFSDEEHRKIEEEGKERYKLKTPPGYMDDKKENNNKYGDLFVWKELLAFSAERKVDIIFVTDDVKEDWWNKNSGKTIGPRVELRKEFYEKTNGKRFHMYNMTIFLSLFTKDEGKNIDDATLDEVKMLALERRNRRVHHQYVEQYNNEDDKVKEIQNLQYRINKIDEKNLKRQKSIDAIKERELRKGRLTVDDKVTLVNNQRKMMEENYLRYKLQNQLEEENRNLLKQIERNMRLK